jgi:hypothetical protein
MANTMKRIIAFVLLVCLFVVIMMLPATPAPAKEYRPLPVWSILCYLAAVAISSLVVVWIRLEKRAVAIAQ